MNQDPESIKVIVTNHETKMSVGANLVINGKNIIDHVNQWLKDVKGDIRSNIMNKESYIQLMKKLYNER